MRNIHIQRRKAPRSTKQDGINRGRSAFSYSSFPTKREKKYFAWGKVLKARSESNDVDVLLDTNVRLNHVGVSSRAWAGSNTSVGFGSRDLPPKDALVLIVFPYGTVDDALVLCSAFTLFGKHVGKWKDDILISSKEREEKRVMEDGDTIIYDKDTGEATLTMAGPVKVVVNGAEIEMTAAGIVNVKAKTGQAINITGGPNVVINNGTVGVNDFPNCPVTGALHCIAAQAIKVP